jgi:hypothetical protein
MRKWAAAQSYCKPLFTVKLPMKKIERKSIASAPRLSFAAARISKFFLFSPLKSFTVLGPGCYIRLGQLI